MSGNQLDEISRAIGAIEAKVDRNFEYTKSVSDDLKTLSREVRKNAEKLAKYENKGAGILLGISLIAGGIGTGISIFFQWIKGF